MVDGKDILKERDNRKKKKRIRIDAYGEEKSSSRIKNFTKEKIE